MNRWDAAYRIAVITLLAGLAGLVRYEGERIVAGQWSPDLPLDVAVENSTPLKVVIDKDDGFVPPAKTWSTPQPEKGLTPEEQRRFDELYGRKTR